MKTEINLNCGLITINSVYKGNKLWNCSKTMNNYNNHLVTIKHNGKKYSFEFWGSIKNPEISTDSDNIFAFYCSVSDAVAAKNSFDDFCCEFGYDNDSRKAEKIYKACEKTLLKVEKVFDCDLYDLINELLEKYDL